MARLGILVIRRPVAMTAGARHHVLMCLRLGQLLYTAAKNSRSTYRYDQKSHDERFKEFLHCLKPS